MPWQEVGVVLVVMGAVAYLARKLFGIGERKRKTNTSFVPLDQLKKNKRP
jgi:hypothetical protein